MTTTFGKLLRKLRVDAEMRLGDMADELKVSSAYASSIEMGRRRLTEEYVEKVVRLFGKRGIDTKEIYEAAAASQDEVRVDLSSVKPANRMLVAEFARRFPQMSVEELQKVKKVLG